MNWEIIRRNGERQDFLINTELVHLADAKSQVCDRSHRRGDPSHLVWEGLREGVQILLRIEVVEDVNYQSEVSYHVEHLLAIYTADTIPLSENSPTHP